MDPLIQNIYDPMRDEAPNVQHHAPGEFGGTPSSVLVGDRREPELWGRIHRQVMARVSSAECSRRSRLA